MCHFSDHPLKFTAVYLGDTFYRNIIELSINVLQFPACFLAGAGLLLLLRDLDRRRFTFLFVSLLGYFLLGLVGLHFRYYLFFFPTLILLVTYLLFQERGFRFLGYLPNCRVASSWLILFIIGGLMGLEALSHTRKALVGEPRYHV